MFEHFLTWPCSISAWNSLPHTILQNFYIQELPWDPPVPNFLQLLTTDIYIWSISERCWVPL